MLQFVVPPFCPYEWRILFYLDQCGEYSSSNILCAGWQIFKRIGANVNTRIRVFVVVSFLSLDIRENSNASAKSKSDASKQSSEKGSKVRTACHVAHYSHFCLFTVGCFFFARTDSTGVHVF